LDCSRRMRAFDAGRSIETINEKVKGLCPLRSMDIVTAFI
jgi:hypothetical protein